MRIPRDFPVGIRRRRFFIATIFRGRARAGEQTESFVNGVPSLLLIKSCPGVEVGETHLSWLFYSIVSPRPAPSRIFPPR